MAGTMSLPPVHDFEYYIGDTGEFSVTVKNSDQTLYDLTGFTSKSCRCGATVRLQRRAPGLQAIKIEGFSLVAIQPLQVLLGRYTKSYYLTAS